MAETVMSNKISQIDSNGECVAEYRTQNEAALALGVTKQAISSAMNNATYRVKGYYFREMIPKVPGLGEFVKKNLDPMCAGFSDDELERLKKIKESRKKY